MMTVTPKEMSERLRGIADRLDLSDKPKLDSVVRDLKATVSSITSRTASHRKTGPWTPTHITSDVSVDEHFKSVMSSLGVRDAAGPPPAPSSQPEDTLWDLDEGSRVETKFENAQSELHDEENLASLLKSLRSELSRFIAELQGEGVGVPESNPDDIFTSVR